MKLSPEAVEYAEDNWIEVDEDTLITFVREALEEPSDAIFWDEKLYDTHTLAFHTPAWNLTDEDIIGQANYRDALDILEDLGAEPATVGHWTYSTYECIKVPMLTEDGEITAGAVELWNLVMQLRDYPLISDETYSELEMEVDERALENALDLEERGREITFTDGQKEHIIQLYLERWGGYFETGYIGDSEFSEVVDDVLNGQYQEHQETKLW